MKKSNFKLKRIKKFNKKIKYSAIKWYSFVKNYLLENFLTINLNVAKQTQKEARTTLYVSLPKGPGL